MELFTTLGFHWARDAVPATLPMHSRQRVCFRFHRMLPEFVWDASMLEGNPFTFPEVKTLLDGVTVGGRRLSDQDQVLNLAVDAAAEKVRRHPRFPQKSTQIGMKFKRNHHRGSPMEASTHAGSRDFAGPTLYLRPGARSAPTSSSNAEIPTSSTPTSLKH